MKELLNGLPGAIWAIERGAVVKATTVNYYRKHAEKEMVECYNDKTGAWCTFYPSHWDVCSDFEMSNDPLDETDDLEPLILEGSPE